MESSNTLPRPQPYDEGIWYQSAVSGLWYTERGAAGDISAIRINGESFRIARQPPRCLKCGRAGMLTSDGICTHNCTPDIETTARETASEIAALYYSAGPEHIAMTMAAQGLIEKAIHKHAPKQDA